MLAIKGVYENGKVLLQKEIKTNKPIDVIITFLEDINISTTGHQKVDLQKFSFDKTRELLKDCKTSLSNALIEERRNEL